MTCLRLALVAALPLLSACTAIVPIDLSRQVTIDAGGGAFAQTQGIDLTANADVWGRRDHIDAISVDEVTARVLSVDGGNQASAISLSLGFRADGAPTDGSQDLAVGTLSGLPLVAGASASLPGSAQLDHFLLGALKGTGHFTVVVSGDLSGPTSAVVEIAVKGSAAYKMTGG
jgi:hypothetical protein